MKISTTARLLFAVAMSSTTLTLVEVRTGRIYNLALLSRTFEHVLCITISLNELTKISIFVSILSWQAAVRWRGLEETIPSGKFGEKFGTFEKFDKTMKYSKLEKKSKNEKAANFEKIRKNEKNAKFEKIRKNDKKSTNSKGDDLITFDGDYFDDAYFEDFCFFDGLPLIMEGADECVAKFSENTYLDIDIDKALDCTESIDKIAWKKYPSCFELEYYTPKICYELFQRADELYDCLIDWDDDYEFGWDDDYENDWDDDYEMDWDDEILWDDDYEYCYFEDMPKIIVGCAKHFAEAFVDLDTDELLNCTMDFDHQFEEKCYSDDYPYYPYDWNITNSKVCETYQQCEKVLSGADYCINYYFDGGVSDAVGIIQEGLEIDDILGTIYNGTVNVEDALTALQEYNDWNVTSEWEWTKFIECMSSEISSLLNDDIWLHVDLLNDFD